MENGENNYTAKQSNNQSSSGNKGLIFEENGNGREDRLSHLISFQNVVDLENQTINQNKSQISDSLEIANELANLTNNINNTQDIFYDSVNKERDERQQYLEKMENLKRKHQSIIDSQYKKTNKEEEKRKRNKAIKILEHKSLITRSQVENLINESYPSLSEDKFYTDEQSKKLNFLQGCTGFIITKASISQISEFSKSFAIDATCYNSPVRLTFEISEEEEEKGMLELSIELNENVAKVTELFVNRIVDEQNLQEFCWTFSSFQSECNQRFNLFKELHHFDNTFLPLNNSPLCVDADSLQFSPSNGSYFGFVFLWKIELKESGEIVHTKNFIPKFPLLVLEKNRDLLEKFPSMFYKLVSSSGLLEALKKMSLLAKEGKLI
eukprot:TRINITY_DN15467_c0_g1_i1.p1 TRINITY_DN15467_c0_g1~~TRINITY_DN15467_c0_g1_i1.p1  ORF type:complete len:393 (-),score=103.26 TRINITY_DN15467_c0_g1_i1:79-1221(-)